MIRFETDQRIVRFERIVRFRLRETDYSLEKDYSLVRIETDLFLQQAPVVLCGARGSSPCSHLSYMNLGIL